MESRVDLTMVLLVTAILGILFLQNTFSLVSATSDVKTKEIIAGDAPFVIGINQNTNMVYVANTLSGSVSVIDGSVDAVIDLIEVGGSPRGIAVNPETNLVYVGNRSLKEVTVIDGSTNKIVNRISLTALSDNCTTVYLSVDSKQNKIYGTDIDVSCPLFIIDGQTNEVTSSDTGMIGGYISVNPNTNTAYVTGGWRPGIMIYDFKNKVQDGFMVGDNKLLNSKDISEKLPAYGQPNVTSMAIGYFGITVNSKTNVVYFSLLQADLNKKIFGSLLAIDGVNNSMISITPSSKFFTSIDVNENTNMIYAASVAIEDSPLGSSWSTGGPKFTQLNEVIVVNASTNSVVDSIKVKNPIELAVNSNTNKVYVSNADDVDIDENQRETYAVTVIYYSEPANAQPADSQVMTPPPQNMNGLLILITVAVIIAGLVVYFLLRNKKKTTS